MCNALGTGTGCHDQVRKAWICIRAYLWLRIGTIVGIVTRTCSHRELGRQCRGIVLKKYGRVLHHSHSFSACQLFQKLIQSWATRVTIRVLHSPVSVIVMQRTNHTIGISSRIKSRTLLFLWPPHLFSLRWTSSLTFSSSRPSAPSWAAPKLPLFVLYALARLLTTRLSAF